MIFESNLPKRKYIKQSGEFLRLTKTVKKREKMRIFTIFIKDKK